MLKKLLPLLVVLTALSGCAGSTVGPGAGAAQGVVKGSVDEVNRRAEAVLGQMNIQVTGSSTKNSGNERQITGKMGDSDVTITLDNAPNATTNVEVSAGKNLVSGNRDLAKEILSRIVQQS